MNSTASSDSTQHGPAKREPWTGLYDFCLVAVDQPTLVPNETGCRPVDQVAASLVSYIGGGVQPANRSKALLFGEAAPFWRFKDALGERMVVRAFLRCLGVSFTDDEIQASTEEPVDVRFRSARFQIMEVVGDKKRGDESRQRQARYDSAESISDVTDP